MWEQRAPSTTMNTFATFACAVCSAMKFGASSERKQKTLRWNKKLKDGGMLGHGRESTRTQSSASATSSADGVLIGQWTSCRIVPTASEDACRSLRTGT